MLLSVEVAEILCVDLECDCLCLASLEVYLFKVLELLYRTVDCRLHVVDVELNHLCTVCCTCVCNVYRHLESLVSSHLRLVSLGICIGESSVAETVSERELNLDLI